MTEVSSRESVRKELQPLDPVAVRSWIKERELPFLNALTTYGDAIKRGRTGVGEQFRNITFEKFVGAGLCTQASQMVRFGMKKHFGKNADVWQVSSTVDCKNIDLDDSRIKHTVNTPVTSDIGHMWLRFRGTDGKEWFIDPTYGQINQRLNRIVMSPVADEESYYHYNRPPESWSDTLPGSKIYDAEWISMLTDSYSPYQRGVFFAALETLTN